MLNNKIVMIKEFSYKYKLLMIILFLNYKGFSQRYQLFKVNRTENYLERACDPKNLPPGQQFISAPEIYVASNHDYIEINYEPGVPGSRPGRVFYGLENMLCGIEKDNLLLVNRCYNDVLNSFTVKPSSLSIRLTTPTSAETGDNSTGDEVTLTATSGYHELVYNWQVYITPEVADILENQGDNRCGFYFQGIGNTIEEGPGGSGGPIGPGGPTSGPLPHEPRLGWINLPNKYLGKDTITFRAEDLFGVNASKVINKSLQFRIGMSNGYNSRILPFSFLASSPKLVNTNPNPRVKNDRCHYSKEATFTMFLNRDLIEDEKLIVSLYDENTSSSVPPDTFKFFKQEDTKVLTANLGTNPVSYSYTWKGQLDAGKYKFRYQTLLGNGEIKSNDPSWATLEFSNEFEIRTPKNITYQIKSTKPETCKDASDGEMNIEILEGEDGRTYKYTLYEVNGTTATEVPSKKNITFTGLNVTITGLTQKKYRVRIQDNEGCFAR